LLHSASEFNAARDQLAKLSFYQIEAEQVPSAAASCILPETPRSGLCAGWLAENP